MKKATDFLDHVIPQKITLAFSNSAIFYYWIHF
jgi:hypothetical protein